MRKFEKTVRVMDATPTDYSQCRQIARLILVQCEVVHHVDKKIICSHMTHFQILEFGALIAFMKLLIRPQGVRVWCGVIRRTFFPIISPIRSSFGNNWKIRSPINCGSNGMIVRVTHFENDFSYRVVSRAFNLKSFQG